MTDEEALSPEAPVGAEAKEADRDARQWAMFCHLGGLAGYVPILPGIGSLVVPLIIWQVKKDDFPFLDEQGKEAVNFQLSILLYELIALASICIAIGIVLLPAVVVVNIVFVIIASVKSNNGERYRYPMCIRFIK